MKKVETDTHDEQAAGGGSGIEGDGIDAITEPKAYEGEAALVNAHRQDREQGTNAEGGGEGNGGDAIEG